MRQDSPELIEALLRGLDFVAYNDEATEDDIDVISNQLSTIAIAEAFRLEPIVVAGLVTITLGCTVKVCVRGLIPSWSTVTTCVPAVVVGTVIVKIVVPGFTVTVTVAGDVVTGTPSNLAVSTLFSG